MTALTAISQELNSTLELGHVLSVALREALQVTGGTYGFVSLLDPGTNLLVVEATQGLTPDEAERLTARRMPVGQGLIGQAVISGAPVLVNDVHQNDEYVELRPGIQSEIAVPISYAESVAGVLNLESVELNAFTDDHVNFLNALASQAAIAIGNAQRREEQMERGEMLRRRVDQLTHLFEIGKAFRTDQAVDQVLEDVVHAIQETVGFNAVMLSLLEDEPPQLRRVAAAGIPVAAFEQLKRSRTRWSTLESVLQERFRIGQSYYVPMEYHDVSDVLDY